ncbi:MAG: OmpA family protein [Xanthomonadales bacterium]|nr:OmpA family protein [Xanthomonadales bacterium]
MTGRPIQIAGAVLALSLAGCSAAPERVDILEEARMAVREAEQDPMAAEVAGEELQAARRNLSRAEEALEEREDLVDVRHDAYLALRHAEIADERVRESRVRDQIDRSEAERNRILLAAREQTADRALAQADRAMALADAKAREAELRAEEAEQATALAAASIAENQRLREELAGLEAEQTVRGLVLTLGDVLFDTDRAELKPGAAKTMDRLAQFLRDYPERELWIEGHTDARGPDGYNLALSEQRAEAVRTALVARGIEPDRLFAVGVGEAYPVATNDTVAGRQENRRVEIVISDRNGEFPDSVERDLVAR